jgi:maltose O-acetyltransferase
MNSKRSSLYLLKIVGFLISTLPESRLFRLKAFIYAHWLGLDIHPTAHIYSSVRFYTYPIHIGARTHVGFNTKFIGSNGTLIFLGDDCDIAPEVTFLTGTHEIGGQQRRAANGKALPIEIGDGCWIGARSIILPGVVIGKGSVIAAGSVVTQSFAANLLIAGVPAEIKKTLE